MGRGPETSIIAHYYNVSEDLNLYQQESKSCALSIKLETHIYKYAVSGKSFVKSFLETRYNAFLLIIIQFIKQILRLAGLEPARYYYQLNLNQSCLPIPSQSFIKLYLKD